MTLNFIVGHRYRLRNGATVKLTRIDPSGIWPFLVGEHEDGYLMTWCPDGSYQAAPEAETQFDLVEEIL